MATRSTTTPEGVLATGLPARLPNRMNFEEEFLALMGLKRRTDARLSQLVDELNTYLDSPDLTLPKSGLRLVPDDDGFLLLDGGPADA